MNIKEFYTAHFKQQIEERSKPLDTTQLQLDSVQLFMEQLGYKLHHPQPENPSLWKGFIRKVYIEGVKLSKCISFQDACLLHNGSLVRDVDGKWLDLLDMCGSFYKDIYLTAHKAKLVEQVYLQRKGNTVKCQQHWVKLVD